MVTYLDDIVAAHRASAQADVRPLDPLVAAALRMPTARPFSGALMNQHGLSVIAEIKRRSPSKGDLAPGLVPEVLAKAYADGGAACLSVLTDRDFFGALPDDLSEARASADIPVLRKGEQRLRPRASTSRHALGHGGRIEPRARLAEPTKAPPLASLVHVAGLPPGVAHPSKVQPNGFGSPFA